MGMPYRVVVSDRNLEKGIIEIVVRATGETRELPAKEFSLKSLELM